MQASPLKFITSLDIFKSPELTLNSNFVRAFVSQRKRFRLKGPVRR